MAIRSLVLPVVLLLCLLSIIVTSSHAAGAEFRVNYVISRTVDDMFYGPVYRFMQAAAEDLGVELNVVEARDDHTTVANKVRQNIISPEGVDGVIVVSVKESGSSILKVCQEYNVPLMIENSAILDKTVGLPRQHYPVYIGEMLPDDEMAGYKLAKYLIEIAPRSADGKVHMAAISGPFGTSASIEREKGLHRAVSEHPDVVLKQIVRANWERDTAAAMFDGLKARYPQIRAIWTASDGMALGVADQAEKMGLIPGSDLVTGGIDWSLEGTDAVRDGRIQASAGGHFMEGAWALVAMFDYLKGIDFQSSDGVNLRTDMYLLTEHNYSQYAAVLREDRWPDIDFRTFSRYFNTYQRAYTFDISDVIQALEIR